MKKIILARQVKPVQARLSATLDPFFDYDDGAYLDDPDNETGPLRYQLRIELSDGNMPKTASAGQNEIDLNDLILNIEDWRTLDQHPLAALANDVDGTIKLFDSMSAVEVGEIRFRARVGNGFRADMLLLIEMDGHSVGLDLADVPVTFSGLSFYLELLPDEAPDPQTARQFMAQYVTADAYNPMPTFDEETVYFAPKMS